MGVIIITLTGVFLSMLIDKRLSFSNSRITAAIEVTQTEGNLRVLRDELARKEEELAAAGRPPQASTS